MTGLSKITDKILAEARADAAEKLSQAEARADEIAADARARAEKLRARIDEAAKREASEIVSRAKSSEAMILRNTLLAEKSAMIDEAFVRAHEEILSLPNEEYSALLCSLATSVLTRLSEDESESLALYGEEISDAPYEILLNSRDTVRSGAALKAALPAYATLLEETAAIDGGLIVRHGRVEVNCSFDALIEQIRPSLEARINRTLFPEATKRKGL